MPKFTEGDIIRHPETHEEWIVLKVWKLSYKLFGIYLNGIKRYPYEYVDKVYVKMSSIKRYLK